METCWECERSYAPTEVDPDGIYLCSLCDPRQVEPETLAEDVERAAGARLSVFRSDSESWHMVAHPSCSRPGLVQLTRFDEHGPVGHTNHASARDAANSALGRYDREPPIGNYAFRLTQTTGETR